MINKHKMWNVLLTILFTGMVAACSSTRDDIEKYKASAQRYIDAEKYEEAVIELQNVIKLAPRDDGAYLELGETYAKLKEPEKAARAFYQAVEINPDNLSASIRMGQMYLLGKALKKARGITDTILTAHPENIEAFQLLASIQANERNLPLAVKTLEKAIAIDPQDPKSHLLLAHILAQMGMIDAAKEHFLTCIKLDASMRAPYVELTKIYETEGNWQQVEGLLVKMIQTSGDEIAKRDDLARFYEKHGQFEKAESVFSETAALYPSKIGPMMELGSYYLRRGRNADALAAYQKAERLDPSDLDLKARMAGLYFAEKDFEKASALADGILSGQKEHAGANFIKGRLFFQQKEFAKALAHFESVIKKDSSHVNARFLKALCLLDSGRTQMPGQELHRVAAGQDSSEAWERKLAMEELETILRIEPDFKRASLLLTDLYLKEKAINPARKQIGRLMKKYPRNIKVVSFLGRLKLLEKDFTAAEKIFGTILKVRPDYTDGYISLGLAYYSQEMKEEAIESFQKAINTDPKRLDALNYLVSIHMQDKAVSKAMAAIDTQAGRLADDDVRDKARVNYLQGKVLMSMGKVAQAKAVFEAALSLDPDLAPPHEDLARIYEINKAEDQALIHYERLNAMMPIYLPVYLDLSRIYKKKGDEKKAEGFLRQALAIKWDYAPAANNLAFFLADKGEKLYEALRLARSAVDRSPKNPDYLDTLGWVYYLQGSYDLALDTLKQSVEYDPENALATYHLGWAYYETGQFEAARKMMAKALVLDPGFKGADKARNLLGQ